MIERAMLRWSETESSEDFQPQGNEYVSKYISQLSKDEKMNMNIVRQSYEKESWRVEGCDGPVMNYTSKQA